MVFNHKVSKKLKDSIKLELVPASEKLFIIFGGKRAGMGMPQFEFVKAANILQESKVFVRDLHQSWYQLGLAGITEDVTGTKNYLEQVINESGSKEVFMVGNSMGGYAALMFSALIGNSKAIAFSPQTYITPMKKLRNLETRSLKQLINTYRRSRNKDKIWDLSKLDPKDGCKAEIYVSRWNRIDYAHAQNVSSFSQVKIHEYDYKEHSLVRTLRDSGELSKILEEA